MKTVSCTSEICHLKDKQIESLFDEMRKFNIGVDKCLKKAEKEQDVLKEKMARLFECNLY